MTRIVIETIAYLVLIIAVAFLVNKNGNFEKENRELRGNLYQATIQNQNLEYQFNLCKLLYKGM